MVKVKKIQCVFVKNVHLFVSWYQDLTPKKNVRSGETRIPNRVFELIRLSFEYILRSYIGFVFDYIDISDKLCITYNAVRLLVCYCDNK